MEDLKLALSIVKAQYILSKKFDKLHIHGLGLSDFMLLYILSSTPNKQCRRIDLAEQLGITASGITRLLAPMEKIGLVARQANERDARVSFVVITEVGERVYQEAKITAEEIANELFLSVKKKNKTGLLDALMDLNIKII
ncbi:MarR family transcriptional regulator [Soonwooa sp.]|uniref:MarR family winged helix-turn-helix transcriptional regulator n=1 Tax=Soonwooa sp. TaxID=1938592 RepID=UPI00262409D1|nr:MarR family transcriptional regulator [Soonwooa sp.]